VRRVLVAGCGSIGERHLRCFLATGRCVVEACEPAAPLREAMRERYGVTAHADLEEALAGGLPDAVVICTPAHLHLPMLLRCLRAGVRGVLVEKPLAVDEDLVDEARAAMAAAPGSFVAVAYVYHHMPWIRGARAALLLGDAGTLREVVVMSGQHFPTFRPAYRDIYYARHESGGGAIQDALTHVVNAVEWCAGPVTRVFCDAAHLVLEGVEVEDTVHVSARHGGVLASYALNQFQAPNEITVLFNGDKGSVKVETHRRRWGLLRHGDADWAWHEAGELERDGLFIAQAADFLDGMEGRPHSQCSFEEGVQTLRFNRAALRSAAIGAPVILS
jgi:predicted dehydrogenase